MTLPNTSIGHELLVTEHDLEQLRAAPIASAALCKQSTRVESAEHLWKVVQLILARAGRATPPGRYVQVDGRWCISSGGSRQGAFDVADTRNDLDRMLNDAGFPVVQPSLERSYDCSDFPPESDSKGGSGSPDPTPMPSGKSGSEPPQS